MTFKTINEQKGLQGLIAECPECESQFKVEPIDLEAANGLVRCGACLKVFDATTNIYSNRSEAVDQELDSIEAQINQISATRSALQRKHPEDTHKLSAKRIPIEFPMDDHFTDFNLVRGKPEHFEASETFFGQELITERDELKINSDEPALFDKTPDQLIDEPFVKAKPKDPIKSKKNQSKHPKLSKLDEDIMDFFSSTDRVTHLGSGVTHYETPKKPIRNSPNPSEPSETKTTNRIELSDEPIIIDVNQVKKPYVFIVYLVIGVILTFITGAFWVASQSYKLGENLAYRPYLETFCDLVGCKLPPKFNVKHLKITNSNIKERLNGTIKVLDINIILFNINSTPMPFPDIIINLTSLNEQDTLSYRIIPEQYLKGELKDQNLPQNSTAHLNFDIPDPQIENLSHTIYLDYPR